MWISLEWNGAKYRANLDDPNHISIPLQNDIEKQANAFGAPPYEASPYKAGEFVGSIEAGAPVNFFNIRVNPHGNGTHTETVGHIHDGKYAIHESLKDTFVVAELVSVYPTKREDGDQIIERRALDTMSRTNAPALIVRTLPNDEGKRSRKYTGTNPPYFAEDAMRWIRERGIQHLLTDLPSVDREEDGGKLATHRIFWEVADEPVAHRTITEMVYVANNLSDGLYLLNIQVAPLILDASPSRPVMFKMNPES